MEGSIHHLSDEHSTFDFFFRTYYTALCFFANSIVGDEDGAKDIVQNCFEKLWNRRVSFVERSETIKTFLYTMVRNECIDQVRKRKTITKAYKELTRSDATEPEYFDEVTFAETVRQILDHVDQLPERTREVCKLYYLEGKNYREIAKDLGTSPEAIRKVRDRALERIRKKLRLLVEYFLFPKPLAT
jgi:RNA polymerase sigma-70 factor (ECF subfamily)